MESHPQIPPRSTALPQTYVQLGNDSLRVVTHNLTWAEARKTCEEDNAHLVSIRDSVTQAYVELLVLKLKQPMWIGLNKNETHNPFRWIDNWPLTLDEWESWEPKNNLPCVYVNGGGNWQTADCNQALPSICKQSSGKDERGNWVWLDHTVMDYTNWARDSARPGSPRSNFYH
ncbi:C-type mannose receptor 2-like [Denticeps clupeoides]|uniref:C-type mannose receptor 2-like n=1 Tax=Denticeps clupeoides TaxID=299321 RepID=UPI0010A37D2A|nr:C-type mannose receptor 2-like [Denticeps clupeoides]